MYFASVGELEGHLNEDCSVLLRNIKAMEDCHYDLLQYNKRTLAKQRSGDDDPFINDEILQHHHEIDRISNSLQAAAQEEREIELKYEGSAVSQEEIVKLMGRVGARMLETYQSSIDKCKSLDEELLEKHLKMKTTLIKLLNQKDSLHLQHIIAHVLAYSRTKLLNELERLRRIVQTLENGEYERVQGAYQFKEKKQPASPEKKGAVGVLSPQKKNVSVQKGKGREASPVWQQLKAQERLRKQRQKVALRVVHGLYSTMDLARQQIIEDMCSNEREKSKRLYNEIFSRNRFNFDQITAFEARQEEFHEKVRLFKQHMELESKRLTEVMRKPSGKREKRRVENYNFSRMEVDPSEEEGEEKPPSGRKSGSNRYRIQSPKGKGRSNEAVIIEASQENFSHIKFESAQSTYLRPKNKLPFLYHQNVSQAMTRAASFDQRGEGGKEVPNQEAVVREKGERGRREEKYLAQRTRVALKNIEVRVDGVMRQDLSPQGREARGRPSPLEYTFYVRRNNRFCEPVRSP